MAANVITNGVQIGQSATPANNFTVRTLDDGSLRISRGNAGAESSDVLVIDASGNFSTAPVLGVGQTWQNVTGSRAAATTYTNSTGKPIEVIVVYSGTSAQLELQVNGSTIWQQFSAVSAGVIHQGARVLVPAGSTYRVTGTIGTLFSWWELR